MITTTALVVGAGWAIVGWVIAFILVDPDAGVLTMVSTLLTAVSTKRVVSITVVSIAVVSILAAMTGFGLTTMVSITSFSRT
ncbi:hypothetical protein [Mucilaginibacter antarcticus]|uniref:hypothetical protein n=1 Tax=Mucilaginibacter antarcticus TaxID=1855725 RepID=UPI00363AB6EF